MIFNFPNDFIIDTHIIMHYPVPETSYPVSVYTMMGLFKIVR